MVRELARSVAARIGLSVAAVVLASTGSVVALALPAAAAPVPVFIRNTMADLTTFCLDQHYDSGGNPTTTVFAWHPCHTGGSQSPGNQMWRFDHLGNDIYRVANRRGNYSWCLSAPNGHDTQVFAELCRLDLPAKQKWWVVNEPDHGVNTLRSVNTPGQCLENPLNSPNGGVARMRNCDIFNLGQRWTWSP